MKDSTRIKRQGIEVVRSILTIRAQPKSEKQQGLLRQKRLELNYLSRDLLRAELEDQFTGTELSVVFNNL